MVPFLLLILLFLKKKMDSFNRRKRNIRADKTIYIFCEGKKTEPLYFEGFAKDIEQEKRRKSVQIKPIGIGANTISLVKSVEERIQKEGISIEEDEIWIVFDKDDFLDDHFDNAIKKARSLKNKFQVAYSNECFELWYLLHFSYFTSPVGRKGKEGYFKKILPLLKEQDPSIKITNYEKQGKRLENLYTLLRPFQEEAIKNAKKLFESLKHDSDKNTPAKQKPSTTVYLLVERLNKLRNEP